MERKINKKENEEVVITFSTNGEEWKKAQKKEFDKLAKKIKVPGFREGHVPEQMAKGKINPTEVLHEALFALVNKSFGEAIKEENLIVFSEPKLDVVKISEEELEATVTFALPPKVELGEYKGLHIEKEIPVVTEADVNAKIADLQKEHATLVVKEGAANEGDTVIIDFVGYINDEAFEGGEAKGYELKLGSHSFVPGFEEQLVGIKTGEKKEILVTFPTNYVAQLAGKEAKFAITCNDVKETVIPEVNQEFVDELEIADVKDIESLKTHLSGVIEKQKESEAKGKYLDTLIRQISDNSTVAISDVIVLEEANAMIDSIKKQVTESGLEFADYLKINNIDEAKLLEDKKVEARQNLKNMLVVESIITKEKIEVTEEKMSEEFQKMADMYGMELNAVKQALEPQKEQFQRSLRNQLFTEFLLANND